MSTSKATFAEFQPGSTVAAHRSPVNARLNPVILALQSTRSRECPTRVTMPLWAMTATALRGMPPDWDGSDALTNPGEQGQARREKAGAPLTVTTHRHGCIARNKVRTIAYPHNAV